MADRHRQARRIQKEQQAKRSEQETKARQTRYNKGLHGLWDRLTGTHSRIKKQNELETLQAFERDRAENDALIFKQLIERRTLQQQLQVIVAERRDRVRLLQNELSQFIAASEGRDLTEFNRISVPRRPHQQERSLE